VSDLDSERAEIEADLDAQGLLGQVTPEDVIGSFGLFEQMDEFSMDPEPIRPALGPDWTYTRRPEDQFFPDVAATPETPETTP
jgi:hypothetical protein